MSGMPSVEALVFVAFVVILIAATRRCHPFLAIVVVAASFGLASGFSIGFLGKAFGTGFAEMIYSPGLVIVGASFIAALGEATAAADAIAAALARRRWLRSNRLAAGLGLVAGIGASPPVAFALVSPLLPVIGGDTAQQRTRSTVTSALSISASHGLVALAPVPIAATAILGAGWDRVALFGVPLAILLAAMTATASRWLPAGAASAPPAPAKATEPRPVAPQQGRWPALLFLLAIAIPLLMQIEQSIGYMPSEPLGGGTARELVLGVGRPLLLFLAGLGIMAAGNGRPAFKLLGDSAWAGWVLADAAGVILTVCAAGGLQRLCQETGMAELLGERLAGWPVGTSAGVLIPFLVAAVIKTLQGSSLVAAITAAGMMQPLLGPLGLGDPNRTALAALAVGAGAMTLAHVNDEYFWLVADRAGLTPPRGLATIGLGTLLQGLVAAAVLLIVSLLLPRP